MCTHCGANICAVCDSVMRSNSFAVGAAKWSAHVSAFCGSIDAANFAAQHSAQCAAYHVAGCIAQRAAIGATIFSAE